MRSVARKARRTTVRVHVRRRGSARSLGFLRLLRPSQWTSAGGEPATFLLHRLVHKASKASLLRLVAVRALGSRAGRSAKQWRRTEWDMDAAWHELEAGGGGRRKRPNRLVVLGWQYLSLLDFGNFECDDEAVLIQVLEAARALFAASLGALRCSTELSVHICSYELIDTWLHRSRNAPLSFSLDADVDEEDRDSEEEMSIDRRRVLFFFLCRQILTHRCRWKCVSINYSDIEETTSKGMNTLGMADMTLLEDLHLHFPRDTVSSRQWTCRTLLACNRSAFLESSTCHLESAPRLEEFYASVPGDVASTDETVDIHLESLRVLGLDFYLADHTAVRSVLDRLTLPSLEDFDLSIELEHSENVSFGIADFLGRSHAPLTRFALQAPAVRAVETLACLRLCPRMKCLNLVDLYFSYFETLDIITCLTLRCDDASESLCPELEMLEFTAFKLPNMYREFSSMLVSRWAVGNGARRYLREVRLRGQDTWFVREGPAKRCVEEGLREWHEEALISSRSIAKSKRQGTTLLEREEQLYDALRLGIVRGTLPWHGRKSVVNDDEADRQCASISSSRENQMMSPAKFTKKQISETDSTSTSVG
ncbi:hypothetical protein DFH11DRAFT_1546221 [Phellopilus nigrolimitatus]|nr:hypothetical protein DFH11DRAFT_1546221 [Phellopilus nigrolimitatus]